MPRTQRLTKTFSRTFKLYSKSIPLYVSLFCRVSYWIPILCIQRDGAQITSFELCDFRVMYEHFEAEKARKKALSSAEKKELKKAKDEAEAKYTVCFLDGRKEKIGNFRVEPPGLFRGRGDHPRKGALKVK
jgi:DNA topoisomerase IB